jgi:hypothetical protein
MGCLLRTTYTSEEDQAADHASNKNQFRPASGYDTIKRR